LETIVKRLERLYTADSWTQEDKDWLAEYLKGDISELYLIALEGFSKDVLENKILLDKNVSQKILSNIHQSILPPVKVYSIKKLLIKMAVAASGIAIVGTAYLYKNQLDNWIDPVKYQEIVTQKGQVKMITLQDGTSVWLNADSKLSYPDKFKGDKREVTLLGEAYFKVMHDNARRFIIHTDKLNTSVLGTSFNIKAYKDDQTIKVAVITGKVAVAAKNNTATRGALLLTPNMQAVYAKAHGTLVSEKVDNAAAQADWYQGNLHYHNMPLPEVIADVQRKYNVVIKADKNLLNCTIYADFNNLPLPKVLKLMGALINAQADKAGDAYRLKGKGCN
jgi:ferric-dicitrate binding protein FerR (iron transport regulator)